MPVSQRFNKFYLVCFFIWGGTIAFREISRDTYLSNCTQMYSDPAVRTLYLYQWMKMEWEFMKHVNLD